MPQYWFIRHGESLAQIKQWDGSNEETPLSPLGVRQAQALADEIAVLPARRVLVSPYVRARETANHATSLIDFEHQIVDGLLERQVGPSWKEYHHNDEYRVKLSTWDWRPPDGESTQDSALRAITALQQLESEDNTLIFAHGRILSGVLALLDKIDLAQPIPVLENCVVHARNVEPGTWQKLLARG